MSILKISQTKKIMVTGGRDISTELSYLARLIGHEIIASRYILLSNGANGTDTMSAEGALMACLLNDVDPLQYIKVFRPINAPSPRFDFGHLRIFGEDYHERRDFVIKQSDAVVIIGGGNGTKEVAKRARELDKLLIPVGIGATTQASVLIWHDDFNKAESNSDSLLSKDDLLRIGPSQYNLRDAAGSVLQICRKLLT